MAIVNETTNNKQFNNVIIQLRNDTEANWNTSTYVLRSGELGLDITNNILKIGNGVDLWPDLPNLNISNNLALENANGSAGSIAYVSGITDENRDEIETAIAQSGATMYVEIEEETTESGSSESESGESGSTESGSTENGSGENTSGESGSDENNSGENTGA